MLGITSVAWRRRLRGREFKKVAIAAAANLKGSALPQGAAGGRNFFQIDLPTLPLTTARWDRLRGTLSYELPLSPQTGAGAAPPPPHWCRPRGSKSELVARFRTGEEKKCRYFISMLQ
jgi:hypothetical protein